MLVAIRCDASLNIGSGHVMRCLTLAEALKALGAQCHFICREHYGHLIEFVRSKGFVTHPLPMAGDSDAQAPLAHANWLGASQANDAKACAEVLTRLGGGFRYLIADHYGLDVRWERAMRPYCQRLMIMDDLADRAHDCDVLVDQTLGRAPNEYDGLLPAGTLRLCGTNYALLRDEFPAWRPRSLQRRLANPSLNRLLVTMGGVDKDNFTTKILDALQHWGLPRACLVTVVMGASAPWIEQVKSAAAGLPWRTEVLVSVDNMAELMTNCDAAIGAAGSTSWERCCLGLPTFMLVLADNQQRIAKALVDSGAAALIDKEALAPPSDGKLLPVKLGDIDHLAAMSLAARQLVDGLGAMRVATALVQQQLQDPAS